jgi:hypothetical protein
MLQHAGGLLQHALDILDGINTVFMQGMSHPANKLLAWQAFSNYACCCCCGCL